MFHIALLSLKSTHGSLITSDYVLSCQQIVTYFNTYLSNINLNNTADAKFTATTMFVRLN